MRGPVWRERGESAGETAVAIRDRPLERLVDARRSLPAAPNKRSVHRSAPASGDKHGRRKTGNNAGTSAASQILVTKLVIIGLAPLS